MIVKEAMHTSASPLFIVTLYTVTGQILQPIPAQGRDDIATRTALDPSRPMVAQDDEGEWRCRDSRLKTVALLT